MRSKKFRNAQFVVGDLVRPYWNPKQPMGFGLVLGVTENAWYEPRIDVYWQYGQTTKEAACDIEVIERVVVPEKDSC
jgi:hypothetical protein